MRHVYVHTRRKKQTNSIYVSTLDCTKRVGPEKNNHLCSKRESIKTSFYITESRFIEKEEGE